MIKKFYLNTMLFLQIYCGLSVLLYGWFFFAAALKDGISPYYLPVAFILVWQALVVIFGLCLPQKLIKPAAVIMTLCNALVFYFLCAYHTPVDKVMFMNALQTDQNEINELLNIKFSLFFIVLGIIPVAMIKSMTLLRRCPNRQKFKNIALSLTIMALCGGLTYGSTDLFLHRFKYLMPYLPPVNYITGGAQVLSSKLTPRPQLQRISQKVKRQKPAGKPNLIIFIMGETSRAANFSLNGYHRPTNDALSPYLQNIIYYPDVQSCGTSTAVAVPCIFSVYDRKNFKIGSEVYTENVLDMFKQAGYKIRWLDNDGGCKDVCNRVYYQEPCKNKSCTDDILLKNLKQKISRSADNQLIVLHTRGSHGPSYHLRYNDNFKIYKPACERNDLWNCTPEELVNVYDNTIHYVSAFIARTIDILQDLQDKYNPILIYTSDHGESLMEDDIFLHSAPYETAPRYQTEVPLLVWLPDNNGYNLNISCLRRKAEENKHSHDNIFHSLLGLGNIKGQHYQPKADIFADCQK